MCVVQVKLITSYSVDIYSVITIVIESIVMHTGEFKTMNL